MFGLVSVAAGNGSQRYLWFDLAHRGAALGCACSHEAWATRCSVSDEDILHSYVDWTVINLGD